MSVGPTIISRKDAKAAGLVRYFTGLECPAGHIAERYVAGWVCTKCRVPKARKFNHRKHAKSQGAETYSTGKPCRNGHIAERRTEDGRCLTCFEAWGERHKVREMQRYSLHKDAINQRLRDRRPRRPKALAKQAGALYYVTGIPCHRGHVDKRRVSDGMCLSCDGLSIKEWMKRNPIAVRTIVIRRRARLRGAAGSHTATQIKTLMVHQREKCAYCKVSIKVKWHVDHITAIANGGSNFIRNIQLLCQPCNQRKNAKDPIIFARELGLLL